MMAGVDMVHVPYRGAAPRSPICSAARCRCCSPPLPASIEHIRAGKLRALAVTTATRSAGAAGHPDRGRFRAGL